MNTTAILLAAGEGTRMKSSLHKVLHPICGKAMIDYPLDLVRELGVERPVVVVGHGAESVREHIGDGVDFAVQDKSTGWGTGHAVMSAQQFLEEGKVYVLAGDMPLLKKEDIAALGDAVENGAACAMLTAAAENPQGYGRVIRSADGSVQAIVEQRDCSPNRLRSRKSTPRFTALRCRRCFRRCLVLKTTIIKRNII